MVFVVVKFDQRFPSSFDSAPQFFGDLFATTLPNFLKVAVLHFKSTLLLAILAVGSAAWGARLCPVSLLEKLDRAGQFILSLVLGYMIVSLVTFTLGFLGFLSAPILYSFLFFFAASGYSVSKERVNAWLIEARAALPGALFQSPAHLLLAAFCAIAFLMAFVPELFYDSLVYHLGLPQMYVNEGRIIDTPHVYFSRGPMLIHMLYVLSLGIDTSSLAKLINWSLTMSGLGAIFVACRLLGWRKSAVWAALLVISMPVVQMNVWSTAIDAGMSVFFLLSTIVLILWFQNPDQLSWLCVAGLLAGAAFASKYTGAVTVIVLSVAAFVLMIKKLPLPQIAKGMAGFALFACLIASPWLIRNRIWTGNPFYPILSSVFESRHMNLEKMEGEKRVTQQGRLRSVKDYLVYPWEHTFHDLSTFNFIGPLTLSVLPVVLFLFYRRTAEAQIFAAIVASYFIFSLLFAGDIRYLLSGFFMLSVLLAGGIDVATELKASLMWVMKSIFVVCVLYHGGWILSTIQGLYHPADVLNGMQSRSDFSATMHNGLNLYPWNVMEKDIRALPEPCRVYMLGNEQVFGFPKRFWYSSCHDDTPIVLWANESANGDALFEKMKAQGFTHLLLDAPEAIRLKGYELFAWAGNGRNVFVDFAEKHLNLIQVRQIQGMNAVFLFEIKDQVGQPQPYGVFDQYFGEVLNLKPQ